MRGDLESPIVGALNTRPKYVASNTLTEPRWANTTVLSGDSRRPSAAESQAGGELQVHGSGVLTRWLLKNDLVDEINLLIVPVVVGQGRGSSPTPAPTSRLPWSTREPSRRGHRSRSTGPSGARGTQRPRPTEARDIGRGQRESLIGGCALRRRPLPPGAERLRRQSFRITRSSCCRCAGSAIRSIAVIRSSLTVKR